MRSNRFDSKVSGRTESNPDRPQEIVLLEDTDLYKYHPADQGPQQQLQPQRSSRQTAGKVAYGGFDYDVHGPSLTLTAPSIHASETSSELGRPTRPFQLHATPYATSIRKQSITSVDTVPFNHRALRPGGPVDLFSRQFIGLLLNWSLVGFFNGSISAVAYPLLNAYLGYTDSQLNAAFALLNLPWTFKFLAGFLSDCIPINRQRRKPYIFIGWSVFAVFMIVMAFMESPLPYKKDGQVFFKDAVSQGSRYVIPLMLGSFAHLLSTVAVEGMMIEFAQREGEYVRGRTQCFCLMFRFIGEVSGGLSMALALNGKEYGGHFGHSASLQLIFAIHAVLAVCGLVITKFLLVEERTATSTQRLATQLRRIWNILQQRTTWQITVFGFLLKLGFNYEIQEHRRIYTWWLGASTLLLNVVDAVSSLGFLIAAILYMNFLINTNWRKTLVVTVAIGLLVMIPVDIITVFDVWRELPLYLTKAQITSVTDAFLYIIRVVVIVEVAEPGYEAVTFGIITTVFNLATMVVSMTKNLVATTFDESQSDLQHETSKVRWHVMWEFLFKYALRVAIVLVVFKLLPRQKQHLKERKVLGNMTIVIPIALFVLFAALFTVSVLSNMLAMFESTECLIFAGGEGC